MTRRWLMHLRWAEPPLITTMLFLVLALLDYIENGRAYAKVCNADGTAVMSCLFNESDTNFTIEAGYNAANISLWGAGGGGSAETYSILYYQETLIAGGTSIDVTKTAAFSVGGGSGSAIINFPVTWSENLTAVFHFSIGIGGKGGTCALNGGGQNGGVGGNTTLTLSISNVNILTLTAYGGGGGGTSDISSFTDTFGGGGGGAGGSAAAGGIGGPAYILGTTTTTPSSPAGNGSAGASSNTPVEISEFTTTPATGIGCTSPANSGTTLGYWTSGGAGAVCIAYHDEVENTNGGSTLLYQAYPCTTGSWGGPCLNNETGCSGVGGFISTETSPTLEAEIQVCVTAGAPGPYGSTPLIPNSGAGGAGCSNPIAFYKYVDVESEEVTACPPTCSGQNGASGGVLISYFHQSST